MAKVFKDDGKDSMTISETKHGGVAISIYEGDRKKEGEHKRTTVVVNPGGNSRIDYHNEDKSVRDSTPIHNDEGGCYLTSACMAYASDRFDDNCYELTILRQFRDNYVVSNFPKDIDYYYNIAPKIVNVINKLPNCTEVWIKLFHTLIKPSVRLIEDGKLRGAYDLYKRISLSLEQKYLV